MRLDVGLDFADGVRNSREVRIESGGFAQRLGRTLAVTEALEFDVSEFLEQARTLPLVRRNLELDSVELRHRRPLVGVHVDRTGGFQRHCVRLVELKSTLVASDRPLTLVEVVLVGAAHRVEEPSTNGVRRRFFGRIHQRRDQPLPVARV